MMRASRGLSLFVIALLCSACWNHSLSAQQTAPPRRPLEGRLLETGRGYVVIDTDGGPQRLPVSPTCGVYVFANITLNEVPDNSVVILHSRFDEGSTSPENWSIDYYPGGRARAGMTPVATFHPDDKEWTTSLACRLVKKEPLTLAVERGNAYAMMTPDPTQRSGERRVPYNGPNLDGVTLTPQPRQGNISSTGIQAIFGNAPNMAGTNPIARASLDAQTGKVVVYLSLERTEPLPAATTPAPTKKP